MKKTIFFVLTLLLLGQTPAMGYTWEIDHDHSGVLFEIRHIYATIRGHFSDFTGDVVFDPDNLGQNKFDFVVKIDSIDTNNNRRDTYLRSDVFFDANKYPVMTFKSSKVSHVSGNKYLVKGKLTIRDVTKNVALDFTYLGQKPDPVRKSKIVAGFDCRFSINRFDYHVGDGRFYKMGVIGKNVDVLITLEVLRDK
jgi:polyisoprenoid-binding protein YceI